MSAVNDPLGLGQVNEAGSTEALFLKIFGGEVVAAYEQKAGLLSRIDMRPMPPGAKSIQIRQIGRAFTRRRQVGADILSTDPAADNLTPSNEADTTTFLSTVNQGEREVFVDDPLIAADFVDSFEEFKNSFDVRGRLAIKFGEVLAVDNDKLAMRFIAKGATLVDWTTTNIPTEMQTALAANEVIDANARTDGSALLDAIRVLSERWDALEVPDDNRYFALRPAQYNLLVQNQDLLNRDFGGENGIFSRGSVFFAWNVQLVKTNSVPIANHTSGAAGATGIRNPLGYNGDFSNLVGVGWHRDAVVGVRAGIVNVERETSIRNQGTLILGKMATGYDIVQPQGVGAVSIA